MACTSLVVHRQRVHRPPAIELVSARAAEIVAAALKVKPHNPAQINADSWSFEFPPQNGVHYLVHEVSGRIAAGAISVWVQVVRTGQVMEVEPCGDNVARNPVIDAIQDHHGR